MDYTTLRTKMVEEQLRVRGIKDTHILAAFGKVPRHKFIPEQYLNNAYSDFPLSIGKGQTISQPYMAALMTQCLNLTAEATILEIGTGSGYQAAILAELAKQVYSVERVASLAEKAKGVLKDLGYHNVRIKVADGSCGWRDYAPYEGIIVTAAAPQAPAPLIAQLKDNARLVVPIGGSFSQSLTVVTKYKNKTKTNEVCGCVFVPLLGRYGWRKANA